MKEVKKNTIIVAPHAHYSDICDVREYQPGDDAALVAGRIYAHDLPLSGEWVKEDAYEWGDQCVACFARWNKATSSIQIVKAHGNEEDLWLDSLGNLWESRWNSDADKWDRWLIG